MKKRFSKNDLDIIVKYVEAQASHIDIDGEPDCGCDDYSVCSDCADSAQRVSLLLKSYGYAYDYADGALSIAAQSAAEVVYARYCAQTGHMPRGLSR